ncbi:MAG: OstA-like protein, partial [Paludibacter sp.]
MKAITNFISKYSCWRTIGYRHIVLFGVLCLFIVVLQAQILPKQLRKEVLQSQAAPKKMQVKGKKAKVVKVNPISTPLPQPTIVNPLANKNSTLVFLENSETLSFDKIMLPDVQVLKGNVRFRHDNALLYCDSAYFYENANSLDAFGNVRIVQGDTLFVYGDKLYYDGNTKLARLRHNVRMVNRKTTLTTDTLVYNRNTRIAQYDYWGKIVNDKNNLVSHHGYYYTDKKEFFFKDRVIMISPEYNMYSDTLMYNTVTETSYFFGPSHIISKDKKDSIYCENGWYNTRLDVARFRYRARIYHEATYLTGDSMY